MKELCDRYLMDLDEYNRLENVSYMDKTDEEILETLKQITGSKRAISVRQKEVIQALLEKCDTDLTYEDELILKDFLKELCDFRRANDAGLALSIHERLLIKAKKDHDINRIVQELYECGMCEWNLSLDNSFARSLIHRFSDTQMYLLDYAKMNDVGRQYMVRCLNNQMLEIVRMSAETIIKTADRIFEAYDWIVANYGSSKLIEQAYLSTARNVMVAVRAFRNGISGSAYEIENVLRYAKIARERTARISEEKLKAFDQWETWWFVQYHCGLIDLDTLLDRLEKESIPDPEDTFTKKCHKVFHCNAAYIEYTRLYSRASRNEKQKICLAHFNKALEFTHTLKRDAYMTQINSFLEDLVTVSLDALPPDLALTGLLSVTINRHRPTCVHTLVVTDLSLSLLEAQLLYEPDVLKDVETHSVYGSEEWKEELRTYMRTGALLHDIGKYSCFGIISNASRPLFDHEFTIIKTHPENGWSYLQNTRFPRPVQDCVRYHHLFHNGKGGYNYLPATDNQPLVDILSIADALDAATDPFGRSYATRKSLDDLLAEFEQGRDTRYSGKVLDLIQHKEVFAEIESILQEQRSSITCNVWRGNEEFLKKRSCISSDPDSRIF